MDKYVFTGTKDQFDNTELIDMLDGRSAAKGEEIELAEDEVETLKASGVKLRKVGDAEDSADDSEAAEATSESGSKDRSGSR